jgi:hypothetical protein
MRRSPVKREVMEEAEENMEIDNVGQQASGG